MKKYVLLALCLCGYGLLIIGCGSIGRSKELQPLMITSAVLPQAALKMPYNGSTGFFVTASGGVPPYRWTWAAAPGSTLPPGLQLSSNPDGTGTIAGKPTTTGPYVLTVTVTDSESPARQKSGTYIITVAASSPSSRSVTAGRLPDSAVG